MKGSRASISGTAAELYAIAGQKLASGDLEGAISAYGQLLKVEPRNAAALNNLGAALMKAGRFREAIETLESALEMHPGYPRATANLGKALREAGRVDEAIRHLRKATSADPNQVTALVNLGDALAATGELAEAEHALERAISVNPTLVEAHMTLGIVRLHAGNLPRALAALRSAIDLAPGNADAHSNLAHALFVSGDWQQAWPHFEYRFQRHAHRSKLVPPMGIARWDGSLERNTELWVLGEQGLGDQIQFVRYTKTLEALGVSCVAACDPRIVKLLSQAGLPARVVPLGTPANSNSAKWTPLLSLPGWHRTRADTVPFYEGYLAADPTRIDTWRARLGNAQGTLRVALAWAGNPQMETGRYVGRSPPLEALAPLMTLPNVTYLSLQKHVGESQLDEAPFRDRILRLPDLDAGPDAFLDTAAVLKCVDLLVTSDTAVAHLAGSLGVATWLCLMHQPDWRWMLKGSTTPWYASMRLFRQPRPGDWASVYAEVAGELAARGMWERSQQGSSPADIDVGAQ